MIKLSILIPSLIKRHDQYLSLKAELYRQRELCGADETVEIIANIDSGEKSIGKKRNELLISSQGKYVAFFDDDDTPSQNYIKWLLEAIEQDKDCCSLTGVITFDELDASIFEHSIKYNEYRTNSTGFPKYERYPNHLNAIKREIAIQFKFPEINHGEDTDWATQIHKSGLLKTEAHIPQIIYHYNYIRVK